MTNIVTDVIPAVDAAGDRILAVDNVFDASMQLLPKLGPNLTPGGVALATISGDGQVWFQLFTYGIIRRKTADGTILDRTPSPMTFNMTPRMSPDGNTLVIIDRENTFTGLALVDLR